MGVRKLQGRNRRTGLEHGEEVGEGAGGGGGEGGEGEGGRGERGGRCLLPLRNFKGGGISHGLGHPPGAGVATDGEVCKGQPLRILPH